MAEQEERIRSLADAACAANGVECLEAVFKRGPKSILRVTVDSEKGVDLDTVAAVSSALSGMLDADNPISVRYTLEVTTPGLDRKLESEAQFRRNVGRKLKVKLEADEVSGKLVRFEENELVLKVDGGEVVVPLESVKEARVALPW